MQTSQIELADGVIEGTIESGVRQFFSIPYAAPVTEERRFREPQPVESWEGVRDATRPGPRAPQIQPAPMEIDFDVVMGTEGAKGPDYLTLNVFAPEADTTKAPVMVFIHGGSFVAGSKDAPVYNGSAFARDGVVCVVINYRLGIEGFLPIPGVPTNLGLRDMIAALRWVGGNIEKFGGDPANVTVFGESGGAYCIAHLMASPAAKGLFHRAICQSGHAYASRDISLMQRLVKRLARKLRIKPTREGFMSRTIDDMLAAQFQVMLPSFWFDMRDEHGRDPSFGVTRYLPVHGDDVLPLPAMDALRAGAGKEIDLLIGTTSEEANIFFVPGKVRDKLGRFAVRYFLGRAIPRARAALRAYGFDEKDARPGHVLTRAVTDLMFRCMTRRMAEAHQGRSYVYEFDWRSPAMGGELGAAHAVELPFVFDTLQCASGKKSLLGEVPPQELATFIHALWVKFAKDGDLPWPEYDSDSRQGYSLTKQVAEYEPIMPAAAFLP